MKKIIHTLQAHNQKLNQICERDCIVTIIFQKVINSSYYIYLNQCSILKETLVKILVICIPETWCTDNVENMVIYSLPNYSSIRQTRSSGKTGFSLAIYIHDTLKYTIRRDLSISNNDIGALYVESINRKGKSIFNSAKYMQLNGKHNDFEA